MEGGGGEEQRNGSGMLPEEPATGEQLREEPAVEEAAGAVDSLSRRSASMWTSDEKTSFLNCFKVLVQPYAGLTPELHPLMLHSPV